MTHRCTVCSFKVSQDVSIHYSKIKGDEAHPVCQKCGSDQLVWEPTGYRGFIPDYSYDRIYATYRNKEGLIKWPGRPGLNDEFFPCGKCNGAALMTSCNCYYEYYECDCGNKFKVN